MSIGAQTTGRHTGTWLLAQVISLAISLVPGLCLAFTVHVPGNQPTIQDGLNAATNGDTVLVAPGTFTGPNNRQLDFAGKSVVLRSSAGAATTIIDCQGAARGFRFHAGETALTIVDGFTIRNGNAGSGQGGGMSIESASPTVRNCVFRETQALNGGGISVTGSSPSFTACQFNGNSAINWGGAVFGEDQSAPIFLNCTIAQSSAPFGAGAYSNLVLPQR